MISTNGCLVGTNSNVKTFFFNKILNEMVTNFNMLSTEMKNMILWDIYSTKVVAMYVHGFLLNLIVFQHLVHPQDLCTTSSSSNIFSFNSRQRHKKFCLLDHVTRRSPTKKKKKHQMCFFYPQHFQPINIRITSNHKRIIKRISQTLV